MLSRQTRSLLLVASGHLVIELCSQFLPVIYPILIDTLGISYAQVGVLALMASVGTSIAQPLFGYLSDLWSPRRLAAFSIVWIGLIMGLVGWTQNYGLLIVVIGLGVLGSAAYHPPAATIAAASGGRRRGAAVSIFSVGGSVGSALSPLLITAGIQRWGMRGTMVLLPIALLFGALLYWQLEQVRTRHLDQPQGGEAEQGRHVFLRMALVVLAVMCLSWFQGSFRTYLPLWIESQGRSVAVGGQMLFVLLAAMGVGSLIGGALSDRIGRWQSFALAMGLLGPAHWLFIGAGAAVQWLLLAFMGMLLGATFPASIVMAQETWPRGRGIASGLVMGLGWLPGGIGASLTGVIADRFSLGIGLRTLVVPAALGVLCLLAFALAERWWNRRDEPARV